MIYNENVFLYIFLKIAHITITIYSHICPVRSIDPGCLGCRSSNITLPACVQQPQAVLGVTILAARKHGHIIGLWKSETVGQSYFYIFNGNFDTSEDILHWIKAQVILCRCTVRQCCWWNLSWKMSLKMALFWRLPLTDPCVTIMAGKLLAIMTARRLYKSLLCHQ